jgi:TolA-binding protein
MTPEVEDELRELKREVIESRGLVIKTNNLANGLSADLKSIAKRQAGYERQITWNSATAYAVFVLVVLIGLKVLWDYRLDNVRTETEGSKGEVEALRKQLKDVEHQGDAHSKVEARAQALYELARNGKRADFLDQIDQVRYRNELALERYTAGLEHVRVARWQEAATAFEEALKIKPDATTTPSTKLALAQSYRKLTRPRDAIPILQALADTAVDRDVQASALWELAQVEVEIQAWNDAKAALRTFLKKWPDHARASDARSQLQDLQSKH